MSTLELINLVAVGIVLFMQWRNGATKPAPIADPKSPQVLLPIIVDLLNKLPFPEGTKADVARDLLATLLVQNPPVIPPGPNPPPS